MNKLKTYRSNGKLLITGEYVVLDGAKALAIPTKYGQSLVIEENDTNTITWKSYDELGTIWFETCISFDEITIPNHEESQSQNDIKERLIEILKAAKKLNADFLKSNQGYSITTQQDFNRKWGLGTSSTLINNIANWAKVDAYALLKNTFGGSGYDIACAQYNNPITFQLDTRKSPIVSATSFDPTYKDNLYFVYLNQKQNSRDGITSYKQNANIDSSIINTISHNTEKMVNCKTLSEFESLIEKHEDIISNIIKLETVKSKLFKDFKGAVKSLGAWGGDFILATSITDPTDYFNSKGYNVVIPYEDMVLK